jgi:hypothetical protein
MKRLRPVTTERAFTARVVELALLHGWHVTHFRASRTCRGWRTAILGLPGYPDLTLCHPRLGLVFAELKTEHGAITPGQAGWIAVLRDAGQRAYVWRPGDWQTILAVLRGDRR